MKNKLIVILSFTILFGFMVVDLLMYRAGIIKIKMKNPY